MGEKTLNVIHKQRINTAANWTAVNPILKDGQIGVERDNGQVKFKVGDGVTEWNLLGYFEVDAPQPPTTMTILQPWSNWSNLPIDKGFLHIQNIYTQSWLTNFSYIATPSEGWTQKILVVNLNSMNVNLGFPTTSGYAFHGEQSNSVTLYPNTRMEFFVIYNSGAFRVFQMANSPKP